MKKIILLFVLLTATVVAASAQTAEVDQLRDRIDSLKNEVESLEYRTGNNESYAKELRDELKSDYAAVRDFGNRESNQVLLLVTLIIIAFGVIAPLYLNNVNNKNIDRKIDELKKELDKLKNTSGEVAKMKEEMRSMKEEAEKIVREVAKTEKITQEIEKLI